MKNEKYLYTTKCEYCGASIKTNRKWQRFCSAPKKCHDLWWADERKTRNQIRRTVAELSKLVMKHSKDIRLIKEKLGLK